MGAELEEVMKDKGDEHNQENIPMYSGEFGTIFEGLVEESKHVMEKKRRLGVEQVKALEKNFEVENKLEPDRKTKLAQELGLQPRQVAIWFQNHRARWKTKQLERDYVILQANYDSLKLNYETLHRDNEILTKEIQELKSKDIEDGKSESKVSVKEEATMVSDEGKARSSFLKEILSSKRKIEEHATINLTEECSALVLNKVPPKQKDHGSFSIPCMIGVSMFQKALCDLGASINLMPFFVFRKIGLGELKPTRMSLQLADRSVKYPRGIIEDVLVKVDKFIFPVDFVVLDMEEDMETQLILGRPFLATGKALIDVQKGPI